MRPSRVLLTMASSEDSTIAASRASWTNNSGLSRTLSGAAGSIFTLRGVAFMRGTLVLLEPSRCLDCLEERPGVSILQDVSGRPFALYPPVEPFEGMTGVNDDFYPAGLSGEPLEDL